MTAQVYARWTEDEPHPAWLDDRVWASVGSKTISLPPATNPVLANLHAELSRATAQFGGKIADEQSANLRFELSPAPGVEHEPEAFRIRTEVVSGSPQTLVQAATAAGLLYGAFELLHLPELLSEPGTYTSVPDFTIRMLNHWDNLSVHPVMGQVERGYAGDSLFFTDGALRADLSRVSQYARLLASIGINRISANNVNVEPDAARLLTTELPQLVRLAEVLRPWAIRLHLSISFASPITLGGLDTADPTDPKVQRWWAETTAKVYRHIPDFGGFVVKADSEGQPGPYQYGVGHAEGANMLADALAPHGGIVFWRAFVYNHRQDWRDRKTDRARAAYDHFAPLDGEFRANAVVQIKYGPIDFQAREPISPLLGALPNTAKALELQVTQEYTGHQLHICYLGELWRDIFDFPIHGRAALWEELTDAQPRSAITAVANVGTSPFWTGHPFAQANLYAYGRLAWSPGTDPAQIARQWAQLSLPDDAAQQTALSLLQGSWRTYEDYTAPLGVGFMVNPGSHYGPGIDGYEYSPWGTYHFADRDGIGVDRSVGSGTGYAGLYSQFWAQRYENLDTCPDELLLFFHHARYDHRLKSGKSVIQHIYDTHFSGVDRVQQMVEQWHGAEPVTDPQFFAEVSARLTEQLRCATQWRDQVNTYFLRKSGIPDRHNRGIHP